MSGPKLAGAPGLLGPARRGGAASAGVGATRGTARAGDVRAILLATDAPEAGPGTVRSRVRGPAVPVAPMAPRPAAGWAPGRSSSSVIGVMDRSRTTVLLEQPSSAVDRRGELAGTRGGTQSVCASMS